TQGTVIYQGQEKPSPGAEDVRYDQIITKQNQKLPLTAEETAFAKAYEQRKKIGPETSGALAADRQLQGINAQIAAENKRELNRRNDVALGKHDDAQKEYRTAATASNGLRDMVTLAQQGNKVAANMQALQTIVADLRAQGFNRLNQVELNLPA